MTIKNADTPATPTTCKISDTNEAWAFQVSGGVFQVPGLTKREMFCLHMGVAETGDAELDAIIRKGNRQKMAAQIMGGLLSGVDKDGIWVGTEAEAEKQAVKEVEHLLTELDKTGDK